MKKLVLYPLMFVVVFLISYKITVDAIKPDKVHRTKILIGTVVDIQVKSEDEKEAYAAIEEAFKEMKRIETMFTNRNGEGEIFRINEGWDSLFYPEDELKKLIQYSDNLWRITGGAFDISLQQLIDAWGFENEPGLPAEDAVAKALASSGLDNLIYDGEKYIRRNKIKLNFGAIAKGYAVDRAIDVLKRHGIKEALVDAGGEIKTIGGEWRVGIKDPDNKDNILYVVDLKGKSVATSGDYEQYFEKDNIRYHHILDPATGYPGNKCRSVSVISGENYFADGLATGIFIMGADKGMELVEKIEGTEALIIDIHGKTWMSSGFNNYLIR
jgi:FAD:protein FMN transferase